MLMVYCMFPLHVDKEAAVDVCIYSMSREFLKHFVVKTIT